MGFRFRRSFRILPGFRLNIGRRGMSASVGVRGAHITLGNGRTRQTAGLPGSGLSYTRVLKPEGELGAQAARNKRVPALIVILIVVAVAAGLFHAVT